jgi:hypothetical protein
LTATAVAACTPPMQMQQATEPFYALEGPSGAEVGLVHLPDGYSPLLGVPAGWHELYPVGRTLHFVDEDGALRGEYWGEWSRIGRRLD